MWQRLLRIFMTALSTNWKIVELIMGKVQLGRDLTESQIEGIDAFLKSLTGEIPKDAMKIPLLPSME